MKTIAERIAEAVADALLLKLEYDPSEDSPEFLVEVTKNLNIICNTFRRIGAKIQIRKTVVTVSIDGESAVCDADKL